MLFFKKKSIKKSTTNNSVGNKKSTTTNEIKPLLPSKPAQQQQHIYLGNDSWLQLNLPGNFCSSIDIPQLHNKKEQESAVQIEENRSTTSTIEAYSNTITAHQDNAYTDSEVLFNTTSFSTKSCNSSLAESKISLCIQSATTTQNDEDSSNTQDLASNKQTENQQDHFSFTLTDDNDEGDKM